MFTFVYQSVAKRETLRDFNNRLREFCADNPVVSIEATALGPNLIIQGTTADDMDSDPETPTFTTSVRTINPEDVDIEEQLDGLIAQEQAKHNPDDENSDPNLPVRFIVCTSEIKSWAVLICINGVVEEDDGNNGGGGDEPEPVPAAPPAAGFQG